MDNKNKENKWELNHSDWTSTIIFKTKEEAYEHKGILEDEHPGVYLDEPIGVYVYEKYHIIKEEKDGTN